MNISTDLVFIASMFVVSLSSRMLTIWKFVLSLISFSSATPKAEAAADHGAAQSAEVLEAINGMERYVLLYKAC